MLLTSNVEVICMHQENISVKYIPFYTSLLLAKLGYTGVNNFIIIDPKHRLWVLVRTGTLTYTHIFVLSTYRTDG